MKKIVIAASLAVTSALAANVNALAENHQVIDGREYIVYDDMLVPYTPFQTLSEFDVTKPQWTDGIVYYAFDLAVTAENKQRFIEASKIWSDVAQVSFIERTNQANYINITNSTKNSATVGMVGGKQVFTMSDWSHKFVIVHELGHTLGMWHEQQRADRDAYVDVILDNVQDDQRFNFTIKSTTNYSQYDFLSVMHYTASAFTKNGEMTIVPKPTYSEYTSLMGNHNHLGGGDQLSVASQYGEKNIVINDPNFKSYLLDNFDTNGDGEIDSKEAVQVTEIHTPGNGLINNIDGVEFFRQLSVLDVSNENISNVSKLPYTLREIDFSDNQFDTVQLPFPYPPLLEKFLITGNPIDQYACADIEHLINALENKTFNYSPTATGADLICTAESKFVLASGKPKLDLRFKGAQTYNINVPENATSLVVDTTNHNNLVGGLMDVYMAFNRQPSVTDFEYSSTATSNVEHIDITNPQAGIWYILLQPSDRSFENVDLVATYSTLPVTRTSELTKGQIVNDIKGDKGESTSFTFEVPENASDLTFTISNGLGDADLYVSYEQKPTLENFDCRPWLTGNEENCAISPVQTGLYHVTVYGYTAFEGLSLVADYTETPAPDTGGSLSKRDIAADTGNWVDFEIEIPQGMSSLEVTISGGQGDADLYIRQGQKADTSNYACRPYKNGNNETCSIENPTAGLWFVSINAYQSFSRLSLIATWK